ncbi:MAG: hypothetical protein WCF85_08980 [Rhodospirillaceae bacterium]
MNSLLVSLIGLVIAVWLGSLVVQMERELSAARQRVRVARDKEEKLHQMIDSMLSEEKALANTIVSKEHENAELRRRLDASRSEAQARQMAPRYRVLVMNARRTRGDKDWVVTVVNSELIRIDSDMPLAREWAEGRNYLVFAKSEQEAKERAVRRFRLRPGTTVTEIMPAPFNLFRNALNS